MKEGETHKESDREYFTILYYCYNYKSEYML